MEQSKKTMPINQFGDQKAIKELQPSKQHKSGTVNQGYEYEKLVPALLALQLLFHKDVKYFSFNINSRGFNKFDDLHIDIEYQNGSEEKFAVQLKHREKGNDQKEAKTEFSKKQTGKNNFCIEEYYNAYNKNSEELKKYIMILFTNVKFEDIESVKEYKVLKATSPLPVVSEKEEVYQFKKSNFDKTFENKFYIMSAQKDVTETTEAIISLFEEKLFSEVNNAICYINFFQQLRNENYEDTNINRDQVILILTKIVLSSYLIKSIEIGDNINGTLIEDVIKTFDLTILSETTKKDTESKLKYIYSLDSESESDLIQLGKEYKFLQKSDTRKKDLVEVVWFLKKKLLFLHYKKKSEKLIAAITTILKTLQNNKLSLVLVEKDAHIECLKEWKIFRNLADLQDSEDLYKKITQEFKISFQGREARTLQCLKKDFGLNLDSVVTPDDIFSFLEGDFSIGTKIEEGFEIVIPMTLLRSNVPINRLKNVCEQKTTVVHCDGKSEELFDLLKKEDFGFKILRSENAAAKVEGSVLVLTDHPEITNVSYHHLKLRDESLEWFEEVVNPKIPSAIKGNVNLISSKPGSGKTTILKIMANNYLPNLWTQFVSLQKIGPHLQKLAKFEVKELVQQLLDVKATNHRHDRFCRYFLEEKRVVFMFDGLNELNRGGFSDAQTIIKKIFKGYKVWISCTKELEKQIEKTFEIPYLYTVKDVEIEDQKKYIKRRLKNIDENKVEEIINKLPHSDILKIPLNLYILTETIRYSNLDIQLNLNRLYANFIEMKIMFNFDNKENANLKWIVDQFKYYYCKQYQIAAVQTCLEEDIFKKLCVKVDKRFIQEIKDQTDKLGLLTIRKDNTFAFSHHTFTEYLAAMWIIANFEDFPEEDRRFIFKSKYTGIRKFFDYELATGHDLHLAVLDQNLEKVQTLAPKLSHFRDEAGRTALHLSASLGRKIDVRKTNLKYSRHSNDSDITQEKIFKCLLNTTKELYTKDKFFKWNPFEYADASMCLFSLEELSKRTTLHWSEVKQFSSHLKAWSYQCAKNGCINLLKDIVAEKDFMALEELHEQPLLFTAI